MRTPYSLFCLAVGYLVKWRHTVSLGPQTHLVGIGERLLVGLNANIGCHRLSRHAIRYNGDLRTSSTLVLHKPMSASSRSSSSRICLDCRRRSHPGIIPTSHAKGFFQDHPRSEKTGEAALRLLVELLIVLPQGMVSPP
jgi:hypothetical protein